jgi:DNA-binding transcriptional LysR family regulator
MLDPRLLRTFTAIVEAGSFTLAAERLHMTQSTISQQLARLEDGVGGVLIERAARPVVATAAGERLLGYARRLLALQQEAEAAMGDPAGTAAIRIGLPEDIVSPAMARSFAAFVRQHRDVRLDVTSGLSRELTRRYRDGDLDIAIVKQSEPAADCRAAFREPLAWFEGVGPPRTWPDPLPLVAFPPGGLYRETMFARIEREQRRWYVAVTGSSLHNVLVAVEAGLGVSLLPVNATRSSCVRRHTELGAEPAMSVVLYARESAGPVAELAASARAVLAARARQGISSAASTDNKMI